MTPEPKKRRNPNLVLLPIFGIAALAFLLYVAVIGNGGDTATPVVGDPPRSIASATSTHRPATPTPASRCQPAPAILLDSIAEGLTVTGGGSLRNGWTVRSDDFEKAHFVAAEITGAGMDGTVGLWVTNNPNNPTMLFSVDAFAKEFSDWGDGGSTDAAFSQIDDGAKEARNCARQ